MKSPKIAFNLIFTTVLLFLALTCSKDKEEINPYGVAYTHVDLIDGVSSAIKTDQTVVVDPKSGVITAIFKSGEKTLDPKATVKDMKGKVMMPGLIEGHYHLVSTVGDTIKYGKKSMENMFKLGITTVRDMAGNGIGLKKLQELGAKNSSPYPKVHFACLVTGKDFIERDSRVKKTAGESVAGGEPWFRVLDNNTDVMELITEAKDFGCTAIKLYADISPANVKRAIDAAKSQNFAVWSHGTVFDASPWDIAESHSFSHADFFNFVTVTPVPKLVDFYDDDYVEVFDLATLSSGRMQDYFETLKRNNTILDATLLVYTGADEDEQHVVDFANGATKAAHLKGVKIGAGVDRFNDDLEPGDHFLLDEIKLIQEHTGMSEAEALQTATINNAIAIGIDKDYGTVEVNKKADLILLNKNPLDDLDNLKSVFLVIKDGYEHQVGD